MKTTLSSLVMALLIAAAGVSAAGVPVAEQLLPDLQPLKPSDLGVANEEGTKMLRFTTDVLNRGTGPLELEPEEEDCDKNGDPDDDRLAYQHVFVDDGDGSFDREEDTIVPEPAGCQHFHINHNHWHFDDFGVYKLLKYAKDGHLRRPAVSRADKVSFCMVDTFSSMPDLKGWQDSAYYPKRVPNESNIDCGKNTTTGISIGWVDRYDSRLPGQEVPIKGLPRGLYCLRIKTDPRNLLTESEEMNNVGAIRLRIVKVVRQDGSTRTKVALPKNTDCAA